MDITNTTDQSGIPSEEFTQDKMFELFDQTIEMAEERAGWEFPVAKPTERYLQALKDLRKEWIDHIIRKSNPDNPPLTPEEDAKATKKLQKGRIKLEQRRKAFTRHIKDNPIDTDKVLAKLKAKVEYKNARNAEKEKIIARMEANIADITAKSDQIKQEMLAERKKWEEENATMTITPEMAAHRKSKVREFERRVKSHSEQINASH